MDTPANEQSPTFEQRLPRIMLEVLFAIYIIVGMIASAWIDFDFNEVYLVLILYVVIPFITFYYTMKFIYVEWETRWRKWMVRLIAIVLLGLLPAHVLLINAATGTNDRIKRDSVSSNQLLLLSVHRGGLGILYRKRW